MIDNEQAKMVEKLKEHYRNMGNSEWFKKLYENTTLSSNNIQEEISVNNIWFKKALHENITLSSSIMQGEIMVEGRMGIEYRDQEKSAISYLKRVLPYVGQPGDLALSDLLADVKSFLERMEVVENSAITDDSKDNNGN